jgi:cytosine/adenosine deaminase-related metal-dependent hydrolase
MLNPSVGAIGRVRPAVATSESDQRPAAPEAAVAMATGNVGRAIPRIGADRGLLTAGHRADVVVATRRSPADIRLVLIDGRVALRSRPGADSRRGSARSPCGVTVEVSPDDL